MTAPPLHTELAHRIRAELAESGAAAGQHLVEEDLCRRFAVSRTPIRGALRLLAQQGVLKVRPGRGYALAAPLRPLPGDSPQARAGREDAEYAKLFDAVARARQTGALGDHFTRQEFLRRFKPRANVAARVLDRLTDLGLLERRAGHGWSFRRESGPALQESYAFRRALEPALLLLPSFRLDNKWARKSRARHMALRHKSWQPEDNAAFHELNADFHEQLARCCGNRHMQYAAERQFELRRFLARDWNYPAARVHSAIDDHLEILAALEQGYADKASALMLHHLTQSATSIAIGTGISEAGRGAP
jgi:DNA-binding GntR family transcriptional regulator